MMIKEFVKPMLCHRKGAFDSDRFIFEKKYDGERVLIFADKENNYFRIQNRKFFDVSQKYPEFSLNDFNGSIILDGELVLNEGKSKDYHDITFKRRTHIQSQIKSKFLSQVNPLTFFVFDILWLNGRDLRGLKLLERKKILREVIKESYKIKVVGFIENNGKQFYKQLLEDGFEGVVAKRKDSIYEHRRSWNWLKIKPIKTKVVKVLGYKETSGWGSFGAFHTEFCDCAIERESIKKEYFERKERGDVFIEIRYQEEMPSGKLRFPKFNKFVEWLNGNKKRKKERA